MEARREKTPRTSQARERNTGGAPTTPLPPRQMCRGHHNKQSSVGMAPALHEQGSVSRQYWRFGHQSVTLPSWVRHVALHDKMMLLRTRPRRVGRALLYVSIRSCTPHDPTPLPTRARSHSSAHRKPQSQQTVLQLLDSHVTKAQRQTRPSAFFPIHAIPSRRQAARASPFAAWQTTPGVRARNVSASCTTCAFNSHPRSASFLILDNSPPRSPPRPPHTRKQFIYADAHSLASTLLAPSAPTSP